MKLKRTDIHHHFYTDRFIDALAKVGVCEGGGSQFPQWSPGDSLEVMARHGIDAAVLSVPIPVWYAGEPLKAAEHARALNEFGAAAVARHPDKFGFFAALPLPDVESALKEITYAFDELHTDGVCLASNYAGIYLGDARFAPVFDELNRRGAVVMIHPVVSLGGEVPVAKNAGSPVPGIEPSLFEFIFDTTRTVAHLVMSGTIKRCTNIRFSISHAGGTVPFAANRIIDRSEIVSFYTKVQKGELPPPAPGVLEEMLQEATVNSRRQLASLYYDAVFACNDSVMKSLTSLVPVSHILMGTDFPMGHEISVVTNLKDLRNYPGLSEEERLQIETNAASLLPRWA